MQQHSFFFSESLAAENDIFTDNSQEFIKIEAFYRITYKMVIEQLDHLIWYNNIKQSISFSHGNIGIVCIPVHDLLLINDNVFKAYAIKQ